MGLGADHFQGCQAKKGWAHLTFTAYEKADRARRRWSFCWGRWLSDVAREAFCRGGGVFYFLVFYLFIFIIFFHNVFIKPSVKWPKDTTTEPQHPSAFPLSYNSWEWNACHRKYIVHRASPCPPHRQVALQPGQAEGGQIGQRDLRDLRPDVVEQPCPKMHRRGAGVMPPEKWPSRGRNFSRTLFEKMSKHNLTAGRVGISQYRKGSFCAK